MITSKIFCTRFSVETHKRLNNCLLAIGATDRHTHTQCGSVCACNGYFFFIYNFDSESQTTKTLTYRAYVMHSLTWHFKSSTGWAICYELLHLNKIRVFVVKRLPSISLFLSPPTPQCQYTIAFSCLLTYFTYLYVIYVCIYIHMYSYTSHNTYAHK